MWITKLKEEIKQKIREKDYRQLTTIFIEIVAILFLSFSILNPTKSIFSLVSPLPYRNYQNEVFGFAPYWKINDLGNVDFNVLTTFAFFGVPVNSDGTLDRTDQGYITFKSDKATELFNKAHKYGTRVVLTLTQMDNQTIENLMDSPNAQNQTINQTINEVKTRGIDGVNIDFEYMGDPGDDYRNKFTNFITNFNNKLHQEIPNSKLTVSVYASSVKDPKIYDISKISSNSDGIFMMAYDFATTTSDQVIPTSPLYGYKQGQYWYDVSTAVNDFLKYMPANKLILGLPWYGYNYPVSSPQVKATVNSGYYTYYWYRYRQYYQYHSFPSMAQTYAVAKDVIKNPDSSIQSVTTGWDSLGQVGWQAYYDSNDGTWRMVFMEDPKSMSIKYDFAKSKNLLGVGIWALGFEQGNTELWSVLEQKFGKNLALSNTQ